MNIKDYDCYREFLKRYINQKILENENLSIRWFSQKLNWPVSLINDVFANRRKLTISRLIELANFIQLNSVETEFLVYLGLKDSENEAVKVHFTKEIDAKSKKYFKEASVVPNILKGIEAQAVLMTIIFLQNDKNIIMIKDLLYTFENLTLESISEIIEELYKEKIVEKRNDEIVFSQDKFNSSFSGINADATAFMSQYSKNIINFINSPKRQGPGEINYKFIALPLERIEELKQKLSEVHSWIETIKVNDSKIPIEEQGIFQIGLTLFPLIDCQRT